jgi:glucose-6-phosphate 1-dehydrogenase
MLWLLLHFPLKTVEKGICSQLYKRTNIMPSISVEPCTFALFGALGDLALRKLFPALYQLDRRQPAARGHALWPWPVSRHRQQHLAPSKRTCAGTSARTRAVRRALPRAPELPARRLPQAEDYVALAEQRRRAAADRLLRHGRGVWGDLREPRQGRPGGKHPVVLEKPIGHDLESSRKVNDAVARSSRKTAPTASTTTWAKRRCRT